ncbi:hypothetical protein J4H86_00205 [Spiractinospora alimapuensis]|uniref:LURP-one-related/scramblase family protein n=1 Tax=Spiractinospora alimapuensis TaxID=2820884 RepID=UPI001F31F594|nr:phospholipid scramblase-related protein [Spiractinospora alimapuensis]QVQ52335.1 hypothetical protein J4H86_00205 [Spiractinospora alimapuensis]
MLPLYRSSVLMVEQPRQLFSAEGYYQVFDDQGFPVAHVREDTSVWNFSRGTKRCPHRFHVLSPTGEPLLVLDKPWQRGLPNIHVYTADSRPVGAIVQDLKLLGSRFTLEDHNGYPLGRIEGSWTNWNFRVFGPHEAEVARISKQHTGLSRTGWRTDDRYAVELGPQIQEPLRTLIVAGAITVDVLLHERDEDFYTGGPGAVRGGPAPRAGFATGAPAAAAHAADRRAEAAERRAAVAERRADVQERKAEVAERKAEIKERKADRAERQADIQERKADRAERRADKADKRRDSATESAKVAAKKTKSVKDPKSGSSGSSSARTGRGTGSSSGGSGRSSGSSSGSSRSSGSSDRGRGGSSSGKRR